MTRISSRPMSLWSLVLVTLSAGCQDRSPRATTPEAAPAEARAAGGTTALPPNFINPALPADIAGGAPNATLEQAAVFAWQEFIALNWPAVKQTGAFQTRETADTTKLFGQPGYDGPLVWHTYRAKVEIFPGQGDPHGFSQGAAKDYGYDDLPQYVYAAAVPPCSGTPAPAIPWINLDENNEIGLNTMYAGVAPQDPAPGQQILFMAKANRTEYVYVAGNGWYGATAPPFAATVKYVAENKQSPPAGGTTYVSFAFGTVELKAAWRQLASGEDSSRFHTTSVRHYESKGSGACYVDSTWALVALHIIHKTPTAPYFVYATFGQADNLLDESGNPVEDPDGNLLRNQGKDPLEPNVTSKDATSANPASPASIQVLSPAMADSKPGKRLYYQNTAKTPTPQGTVSLNKRKHDIPPVVIGVNQAVHQAIAAYDEANGIPSSPWLYYKLVNVQYKPIDKPNGQPYTGPDPATYYQANVVVETDYNLQVFSGQFQPTDAELSSAQVADLITDWNVDGTPFKNANYAGQGYNMGGCMGCHANAATNLGSDFSFILRGGRVSDPETAGPALPTASRRAKLQGLLTGKR